MRSSRILVVEDDRGIAELLVYNFEVRGYECDVAGSAEKATVCVAKQVPDIMILDWMLPGESGLGLLKEIRKKHAPNSLPIIMLSARSEEQGRVRALDCGADDFVIKPFSIRELTARVERQLERKNPSIAESEVIRASMITIDIEKNRVFSGDVPVHVGPTEFKILKLFMQNLDKVLSREFFVESIYGNAIKVDIRTIDVHVGRLRKSLATRERYSVMRSPIRAVRGLGYQFKK